MIMASSLAPSLLLSMPQLQDPNFARTVVLLCDYVPEGAFGLVLNRPTDMPAASMVRLDPPIAGGNDLPLCLGGPVEPERGWILMADEPDDPEHRLICEGVYLSTSPDLLRRVLAEGNVPEVVFVEDAGHFLQNEAPDRVNEELVRWLGPA